MISFLNSVRGEMPVERVTAAKGMEGLVVRGPTLQQHRIIKVAHDSGWYEVPKKISIRDLATKLGLSKSSVAEQLVKAESEIVGGFLKRSK
jgi:predicted DNA binding protein